MNYQPLTADDIRVVRLIQPDPEHNAHSKDTLFTFRLEHRSLASTHTESYIALSYVWGTNTDPHPICVNGHEVLIRPNLYHAFTALRKCDFLNPERTIWVDQLCIDQGNVSERNREVHRMAQIFKTASSVVVWLGCADEGSDEVMDFINTFAESWDSDEAVFQSSLRQLLETFGTSVWLSLQKFLQREYWWRTWIVQEIVMGGESSVLVCGTKTTTWQKLYNAMHYFNFSIQHEDPLRAAAVEVELRSLPDAYNAYHNDLSGWRIYLFEDFRKLQPRNSQSKPTMQLVLERTRSTACQDPRDKVYGILALLDHTLANSINADYRAIFSDVYKTFASKWIEIGRTLDVLMQCGEHGRDEELALPSWTPDLRKGFKMMRSNYGNVYQADRGLVPTSFRFSQCQDVLRVQGITLDRVDGLSGRTFEDMQTTPSNQWSAQDDLRQSSHTRNAYGSHSALVEALWRVLIADRTTSGDTPGSDYRCILENSILDERTTPSVNILNGDGPDQS